MSHRNPKSQLTLVLAGSIFAGQAAFGTILLEDNFDSYADQTAFQNNWTTVGASLTGTLSTTQALSVPNSINYTAATSTATAQRNERFFTESGFPTSAQLNNVIRLSFDFYDSDGPANPYRQYVNLQDGASPASNGQLVSLGLNNNLVATADGGNFYMARILGFNGGAYFKLNDNPALLRSTGWHNLAVEISDLDFKFFVDGQLAETVLQGILPLRSYELVRLGSGFSSTREAYFDNVRIETVPEPSSMVVLLGVAGAFGLIRRRN